MGQSTGELPTGPLDRPHTVDTLVALLFCAFVVVDVLTVPAEGLHRRELSTAPAVVTELAVIVLLAVPRCPNLLLVPLGVVTLYFTGGDVALAFACYLIAVRGRRHWLTWLVVAGVCELAASAVSVPGTGLSLPVRVAVVVGLPAFIGRTLHGQQRTRELLVRTAELRVDQATALERARIQRELHDTVAHGVTLMMLRAGALEVSTQDAAARQAAIDLQDQAQNTLDDIRVWYAVLRSAPDDGTDDRAEPSAVTATDLAELVHRVRATGAHVTLSGPPDALAHTGRATRLAAYRIAQEALTNAVKYAPGARVEVGTRIDGDRLHLHVRNDSASEPPARPVPGTGLGLIGLHERTRLIGGTLLSGPTDDGGFLVRADLPLHAQETPAPNAR